MAIIHSRNALSFGAVSAAALFLFSASEGFAQGQAKGPDDLKEETFDAVWNKVNKAYFDSTFGGNDWKAIGETYRPRALGAKDLNEFRGQLTKMLESLGKSHMGIMAATPEADAEFPVSDPGQGELHSGIHLRLKEKRFLVTRVEKGSAGEDAGIRRGQEIRAIGGKEAARLFKEVNPEAMGGLKRLLLIRRVSAALNRSTPEGQEVTVFDLEKGEQKFVLKPRPYDGAMSRAFGNLPPHPLDFAHEKIPVKDGEVVYLRFAIFVADVMPMLRKAILEAGDARGMIFDLRGNPGGLGLMASGIAGLLTDEELKLGTMQMREGHINFVGFPQSGAYLGPVAILVDHMSGSTSEIFAGALQELGRARVFGRRTMGAALPSQIVNLPNGDKLQYAMADFQTSGGKAIEGNGVEPDVQIELGRKWLLNGQDKALDKALSWVERQKHPSSKPTQTK